MSQARFKVPNPKTVTVDLPHFRANKANKFYYMVISKDVAVFVSQDTIEICVPETAFRNTTECDPSEFYRQKLETEYRISDLIKKATAPKTTEDKLTHQ